MSVPLDRLYHYLDDCVNHDLLIYGWMPHGSRKLEDFTPWNYYSQQQMSTCMPLICHDQEPLNFTQYSPNQIINFVRQNLTNYNLEKYCCDAVLKHLSERHLRGIMHLNNPYDCVILLHSELNSSQVDLFAQAGFVPAYYWSHALISQDWFRYAEHDLSLKFNPARVKKDFLIYNRAWQGTREYRLYFTEKLIENQLLNYCQTTFNPQDECHYSQHIFKNKNFQITNYTIEQHLSPTQFAPTSSADYNNKDYSATGIEVVLETLFDDTRWHLTEKALRPIACGRPFILAATPGSLQYLRMYGFKTFSGLINESYDQITEPHLRLQAIIGEMKRITNLSTWQKQKLYTELNEICQYNQQHFFHKLSDKVITEFKNNVNQSIGIMQKNCTGQNFVAIQEILKHN
jgi:hypothetical protein